MSRGIRIAFLVCTLCLAIPFVAGPTAAQDSSATDLELEEAIEDDTDSDIVSFTFEAAANETVEITCEASNDNCVVTDEEERQSTFDDSDVVFRFHQWENLETGERGPDPDEETTGEFEVRNGVEYRIEFEVTAGSEADAGERTAAVEVSGVDGTTEPTTSVEESLSADVSVLSPTLTVDDPRPAEIRYEPGDGAESTVEVEVVIQNEGDGILKPSDVTIDEPGFGESPPEVAVEELPERIEPGMAIPVVLELTADEGVPEETHSISGDVRDNLENRDDFAFEVTVVRPAYPAFESEPLDLGEVLVGETATGEITIEEIGGHTGLDGVEWDLVAVDFDAELSFDGMSGTDGVATAPGGEDTVQWTIDVDEDVEQHERLTWTIDLEPVGHPDATRRVDVEAEVIYPPDFGRVSSDSVDIVFDEPRRSTDGFTETVTVDVENTGDLALDLAAVSPTVDQRGIDATVVDEPESIAGLSEEPIEIEVTAETGVDQGRYDLSIRLESSNESVEPVEYETDVTIHHETRLAVSRTDVALGDVAIGEPGQEPITIEERLGYQEIENLELTRETGPETWLEVADPPPNVLAAGDSSPVVFEAAFDTTADVGSSYEWRYVVDGDNIDRQTITITATPIPLDLEPIRDDVASYTDATDEYGTVATETAVLVDELDASIRNGDVPNDDISRTLTFSEAALLYLEGTESATSHLENGEYDEAQDSIIRAAAAYNTMRFHADELEDEELNARSEAVVADADGVLDRLIDRQIDHYESRLESDELSLIEEATVQRRMASVVSLQGDEDRAESLERDAADAFDTYSETVAEAESAQRAAEASWSRLQEDEFVTVAGQPLLLNPAAYDTFTDRRTEIHAAYEDAADAYEAAGETSRAEAVAAEHETRSERLDIAGWSLVGALGLYLLVTLGIVGRTARQMYRYVRDARESVTGDFLVE